MLLYIGGMLVFVLAILVSIALHELGHLSYAKRYGCRVSYYMIGFGPTIWSRTAGETEYGIKLIPLGGYIKIIGMLPPGTDGDAEAQPDGSTKPPTSSTGLFAKIISETRSSERELVRAEDRDRLFYKLPWNKKAMVMFAGPAVNICLAFACLQGVYGLYGEHAVQPTGSTVITRVSRCVISTTGLRTTCRASDRPAPAWTAGMRAGDRIVSFNGRGVRNWPQLQPMIWRNADRAAAIGVIRHGHHLTLHTRTAIIAGGTSRGASARVGFLGVTPQEHEVVHRGGPIFTMAKMGQMTAGSVSSIVSLPGEVWNVLMAIMGQEKRDQNGPISIVGGSRMAGDVASSHLPQLHASDKIALLGLIIGGFNLFIGLFNLLPCLPLDGGHIAGALWEALRRKLYQLHGWADPGYVDVARQMPIAYCVGLALLAMVVVLIIGDIVVPVPTGL